MLWEAYAGRGFCQSKRGVIQWLGGHPAKVNPLELDINLIFAVCHFNRKILKEVSACFFCFFDNDLWSASQFSDVKLGKEDTFLESKKCDNK